MEVVLPVLLGVGLAAAAGFRIFVPPLVLGLAARLGHVPLPEGSAWIASTAGLALLASATLIEVLAYYVPVLDNLLDTLALPAAVVSGTLLTGTFLDAGDPLLRWSVAAIVGGGAAAGVQGLTTLTRLASTGTTGGLANPVVSTVENVSATLLSILAITLPLLAVALAAALLVVAARRGWRFVRRRRPA